MTHPRHAPITNASFQLTDGKILGSVRTAHETHALASSPETALDDSITGPNKTSKLFRIRGLINSLLGNVTPEDRI